MTMVPEDHFGSDGTDVTQVLHMGSVPAGADLVHHDWITPSVGFAASLYAYSLPNGQPGRPFVRFAAGSEPDEGHFDTHSVEALREYMDRLVRSLSGLTDFTRKIQAWDLAASAKERAWDEAARAQRPCRNTGDGHEDRCAVCDPAGAAPSEVLWTDLMRAVSPS
ncbi:hypothetical protein ABZ829_27640 [Streptomyces xanthochromogenes]|uniref:hypothetical protein n=1 Tax=Streptomyces xanthochromogenes TaxID=67384 RepID=UPI00342684C7